MQNAKYLRPGLVTCNILIWIARFHMAYTLKLFYLSLNAISTKRFAVYFQSGVPHKMFRPLPLNRHCDWAAVDGPWLRVSRSGGAVASACSWTHQHVVDVSQIEQREMLGLLRPTGLPLLCSLVLRRECKETGRCFRTGKPGRQLWGGTLVLGAAVKPEHKRGPAARGRTWLCWLWKGFLVVKCLCAGWRRFCSC